MRLLSLVAHSSILKKSVFDMTLYLVRIEFIRRGLVKGHVFYDRRKKKIELSPFLSIRSNFAQRKNFEMPNGLCRLSNYLFKHMPKASYRPNLNLG